VLVRSTRVDLYAVLGVSRSATLAELRHAYRTMALAHHPDRAGAASASTFAGIADAYRVLSNPVARSAYDASLVQEAAWNARARGAQAEAPGGVHSGGVTWTVATGGQSQTIGNNSWKTSRPVVITDLLPRVSGRLDELTASRIASLGDDGVIDLHLNTREAASGGTAAIEMSMHVVCSSCGGVARPRGVWCRICQHDGRVTEDVTVCIRVPPYTHPGSVLSLSVPRAVAGPRAVRIFVHGLRPQGGWADSP
jgi:molecular chaperone DnaJ